MNFDSINGNINSLKNKQTKKNKKKKSLFSQTDN